MPRRTTVSRHTGSRYGSSAAMPGTVGWTSQSIGGGEGIGAAILFCAGRCERDTVILTLPALRPGRQPGR